MISEFKELFGKPRQILSLLADIFTVLTFIGVAGITINFTTGTILLAPFILTILICVLLFPVMVFISLYIVIIPISILTDDIEEMPKVLILVVASILTIIVGVLFYSYVFQ